MESYFRGNEKFFLIDLGNSPPPPNLSAIFNFTFKRSDSEFTFSHQANVRLTRVNCCTSKGILVPINFLTQELGPIYEAYLIKDFKFDCVDMNRNNTTQNNLKHR